MGRAIGREERDKISQIKNLWKVGANNIADTVLDGVHYYNIPKEEKGLVRQIKDIQKELLQLGLGGKHYVDIMEYSSGETVIIDKDIYEFIAIDMFKAVGLKNPKLKNLAERIDIEKNKKYEMEQLCEYIAGQPENEVDIYLYKMRGKRTRKIFIEEGKGSDAKKWIKEIKGYRLTVQDIENTNELLSQKNKKITNVILREMINAEDGIRVTLEIGDADFIKI